MFGLFHFRKNRKNKEANQPEEEDKTPSEHTGLFSTAHSLVAHDRVLLCGASMFLNTFFKEEFLKKVQALEVLLSTDIPDILEACRQFEPSLLILTSELSNLPELAEQILHRFPRIAIVASSANPSSLPYDKEELARFHIVAVLPKPCGVLHFIKAMEGTVRYTEQV